MNKEQYRRSFENIRPDKGLEDRVVQEMLGAASTRRRALPRMALIAAAVLLVGGALAAAGLRSSIVGRLYPDRTPDPAVAVALVTDADRDEAEGVSLTLDEYLIDGNTMNVAWTVTSSRDEPVYYLMEYAFDTGDLEPYYPYGGSSGDIGDGALVVLTKDAPVHESYAYTAWQGDARVPVGIQVKVYAFTSGLEPVQVDVTSEELRYEGTDPATPAGALARRLEAEGRLGIASNDQICCVTGYEAYQRALDAAEANCATDEDFARAQVQALSDSGLFAPLAVLTVSAEAMPDADHALFDLAQPMTFDLPGRRVTLSALRFDMASTLMRYDVLLDAGESADNSLCWYLVEDPQGRVMNVDWALSLSGSEAETVVIDGEARTLIHYTVASDLPVTELPDAITFVPVRPLARPEGMPSRNYWQAVADLAAPEECFTVPLK